MHMATPEPIYYNVEMVRALGEADSRRRYECVRGELLVTPAPRVWHEVVVLRLVTALANFLRSDPRWIVFGSLSDLTWGFPDTLVSPDAFVAARAEAVTGSWDQLRTIPLAIEVLSPTSLRADRFTKRRLYQEREVALYWVVDADAHSVEVWTPETHFPTVERETLTWQPAPDAAPFVHPLADLFAPL